MMEHPVLSRQSEESFQIIFLTDSNESVDVVESSSIDFEEVIACVKLGGSVFITRKT
jgi:hypothetical protein